MADRRYFPQPGDSWVGSLTSSGELVATRVTATILHDGREGRASFDAPSGSVEVDDVLGFFVKGLWLMNLRVDKLTTRGATHGGYAAASVFEATILKGADL